MQRVPWALPVFRAQLFCVMATAWASGSCSSCQDLMSYNGCQTKHY